ncbi:hypothetical protein [Inquilinus limosus]|uniref:hypothetical protein n=1 Tax=Inquilinus limosus TaxID=171674 RepID=UPI0011982A06|nr:hypothetical protein [Inquilinus limosus]
MPAPSVGDGALYPSDAPSRTIAIHRARDRSNKALPKGITWDGSRLRYRARVIIQGRAYHGGWFDNLPDAVEARNRLALKLYGSDARLVSAQKATGELIT